MGIVHQRLIESAQFKPNEVVNIDSKNGVMQIDRTGLSHIDNAARNRKIILNIIRTEAPISRKEVAQISRLSIATTKRLIEELLRDSLVVEVGVNDSTRGRKASLLQLNSNYCCAIGLNIIHYALEIVELSFTGKVIYQNTIEDIEPHRDAILPHLRREIRKAIEFHEESCRGKLLGIGIGIAGLVNTSEGLVLYTPNMTGWDNVALAHQLKEEFNTDAIVDDTVRCMTLSEKRYGAAKELSNFLYIYIGRGVGSGILLDGRIYRGKHGVAGEFGHMTIREDGNLCNCGNRGCLEAHVSMERILEEAKRGISLEADTTLRTCIGGGSLEGVIEKGRAKGRGIEEKSAGGGSIITLQSISSESEKGDRFASSIINRVGEHIGTGIANLVNVFDPGVIILGGEVIDAFGEPLIKKVNDIVQMKAIRAISSRTRIVRGEVMGWTASRGAATLLIEKYLQNSILNI